MSARFLSGTLAGLCLCFALAVQATAQDQPLAKVPANAPIVVQLNGLDNVKGRLGKMIGNALPDMAPLINQLIDGQLREMLNGRDLKGVNTKAPIFFVFASLDSLSNDQPDMLLLVPVSNYAEFRDNFLKDDEKKSLKKVDKGIESVILEAEDSPSFLIDMTSTVALTNSKMVAETLTKPYPGLQQKLGLPAAQAFLKSDVAVYVNMKAINEQYGDEIKGLRSLIDTGLEQAQGETGLDKRQMAMAKTVIEGLLQMLADSNAGFFGIEFRPEGLHFRIASQFGSDTKTNAYLKRQQPSPLKELGSLPSGQMNYNAIELDPDTFRTLNALTNEFVADGEAGKILARFSEELEKAGLSMQLSSSDLPASGLQVLRYRDPVKAAETQLKLFQALPKAAQFQSVSLKGLPEVQANAQKHRGFQLHAVRMTVDLDKSVEALPEAMQEMTKNQIRRMIGEEIRLWFGTDGKTYVTLSAKDWKSAQAVLDQYLDGKRRLDLEENFQVTRKNLPREATLLAVADTGSVVVYLVDLLRDALGQFGGMIPGIGVGVPNLKKPEGKPSYLGAAIVLKDTEASVEFFVPTTAVQQLRQMFSALLNPND